MAGFLRVGNRWLNLDRVEWIELVPDPVDSGRYLSAKVQFYGGKPFPINGAELIVPVVEFLKNNSVPTGGGR